MWTLLMAVMLAVASSAVAAWLWLNEPWLPMCAARGPLADLGTCLAGPLPPAIPNWDLFLVVAAAAAAAWTVAVAVRAIVRRRLQPADYLAGLTVIAVTTLAAFMIAWPRGPQLL
jgi:hypothetical protein